MADPVQQQEDGSGVTETPRMRALRKLSDQLPVANAGIAAGQQAARDIQLQQAVRQARPSQATQQTAQTAGAAMQTSAGGDMVEAAKASLQNQGQLAQAGLAEQAGQAKSAAASAEMGIEQTKQDQVSRFAQLSADAKKEMFDATTQFHRDEAGRAVLNDRQLSDYARVKAENDEQFKNYAQKSEQLSKKKLSMMGAVQQKLELQMKQEQAELAQYKDALVKGHMTQGQQATTEYLAKQKATKLEELGRIRNDYLGSIREQQSSAASRMAQNQALGGIVGAVAGGVGGFVIGGPMGAVAGAAAGQGLGSAAGGTLTQNWAI